ncbi:hypothetical protein [Rhodoplanes roseus]|uniref:Uncharacterized protein n=1 Tax=Rhodoplanes roseus TaxID=29409 RepID=A0A327KXI4_9BRAD|nr:hypothetical protein [Rhodoplanes roseus]RAI43539.1 hypothetical protein CH341_13795 [Rhodoplanes roseus]
MAFVHFADAPRKVSARIGRMAEPARSGVSSVCMTTSDANEFSPGSAGREEVVAFRHDEPVARMSMQDIPRQTLVEGN